MKSILPLLLLGAAVSFASIPTLDVQPESFAGRSAEQALANYPEDVSDAGWVFARAAVETLVAVEELGRGFYEIGLAPRTTEFAPPFFRMPVPTNPAPRAATAADVRRLLDQFHGRMAAVDARLATIEGREFQTILPLGAAGFDFVGRNDPAERVNFGPFFAAISRQPEAVSTSARSEEVFTVAFDHTDALWLRAYTNLLRGIVDVFLAHDGGELFEASAQLFFVNPDTALMRARAAHRPPREDPAPASEEGATSGEAEGSATEDDSYDELADLIALAHRLDLPIAHPERLARAREEFLEMIRLSRATLDSAAAEVDDEREWLPAPRQASAIGVGLSADQVTNWRAVLAVLENLLNGDLLLAHWRFPKPDTGVNVRRLLAESRRTDLIGYVHGYAAAPYLEQGTVINEAMWLGIIRIFGGNFLGYALWLN